MNQSSFSETSDIINSSALITITTSLLSILGGLFIIFTYVKIPHLYHSTPRKLLVNITLADLLSSLFYFVGALRSKDLYGQQEYYSAKAPDLHSDLLCKVQSFFTSYGSIASFFWTDILAVYLFVVVTFHASTDLSSRTRLLINLIGWVLPVFIVLVAAFDGVLGEDIKHTSGPWCWIEIDVYSTHKEKTWLFLNGKAYELLTYVVTFVLYIWMKIIIRRKRNSEMPWLRGQTGFRENDEKFWLTWIVLLVLRLPGTIRTFTFLSKSTNREIDQYLLYLQSFGDVGQALINCIIYCMFDSDVSDYVKEGFLRYKNKLWHGDAHVYLFTSLRRSASSDHLLAKASSDHLLAK